LVKCNGVPMLDNFTPSPNDIFAVSQTPEAQMDELQQLYDNAPCGYHSLDENGLFVRINQTELTMLGYRREEIVGKKKFSDLLTVESQKDFQNNFPQFKQQGWVRDLEFEMVRQDGTILPVSISATVIRDPSGNYLYSRSVVIDISERKHLEQTRQQTEAELRESESRYRLLFANNPSPMWTFDPETLAFLEVNQAALDLYGYSHAEFAQMTLADIRPQADIPALMQATHELTPGDPFMGTWQHCKKDGTLMDVEVVAYAFTVAGKQVNLARVNDITAFKQVEAERQQVEQAIRISEQKLNLFVRYAPVNVAMFDQEMRYLAVSQRWVDVYKLGSIEDVLGQSHYQLFPNAPEHWLKAHRLGLAGNTQRCEEDRFVLSDGSVQCLRWEVQPWEKGTGEVGGILIFVEDITDRKQVEQERERFLALAADLQVVISSNGYFQWVSPTFEQALGWTTAEITSRTWIEFVHPDDVSPSLAENTSLLAGHETFSFENRYRHKDGSYRWFLWKAQFYPQEQLIYSTAVDITGRKQLENQFLRAQRLESLGTLASGIAHDLNNVLTPILGIAQLLPTGIGQLDDRNMRLLQTLEVSARRGADLVKQILSFTRGIEGKPTSTQVSHLLAEIQKILLQTFPKNIELSTDLPSDLWLIAADVTLLHQVFMNLCVNARDAMPDGGTLQISAENLVIDENYARMHLDAQVGSYVAVTIADTGTGIPLEILDRIFDPFFTTKGVGQGTGLGLATVLGILKTHHGFINVYSEVNKGSRFKIYLPATETQVARETPELPPRLGAGELILVVDDEVAIQEITQATLETHGYRSLVGKDGVEAIALYAEQKQNISVILLDLMMPALDTATIIRTLHRLNPEVKIIAMSGLATNEAIARTMREGVQGFLAKPFTATELLNLLSQVCAKNG
jgi:PAS domain S-box-containing protein